MKRLVVALLVLAACGQPQGQPQGQQSGPSSSSLVPWGGLVPVQNVAAAIAGTGLAVCGGKLCARSANEYSWTHLEWSEEFASTANTITFSDSNSGTGSAITTIGTEGTPTTRFGIIDLATGTTTSGRAARHSPSIVDLGSYMDGYFGLFGVSVTALSTSTQEYFAHVGFFDADTVDITDGCYWQYDRANSATGNFNPSNLDDWEACCANNSTRTCVILDGATHSGVTTVATAVAAGAPPTGTWQTLEVTVSGATSAVFSANGATVATLTTNLPVPGRNSWGGFEIVKSAGTTSRSLDADADRMSFDLPSARSP